MDDYILIAIIALFCSSILMGGVQWRFGNGLLTKIFRIVMISVAVIAYIAFIIGKQGINFLNLSVAISVVIGCIIAMVLVIQSTVIKHIQLQSDRVSKVVKNLSMTSNEAASSAEEQASAVTQVSTAVEEIHQMSQNTASTSQDVVAVAGRAVSQGHDGLESIRQVLHVMELLAQATSYVEVVNQVAEKSNLLAFNAGIEAAKAEEYGRGFSVVAAEVRNLAEQSKQAAKQIQESIKHTESGRKAILSTDNVMADLGAVLQDAAEKARHISGAAIQQSAGIKQISDAMGNLIQGGEHTALTSRQIREAASELAEVTSQLSLIIHGTNRHSPLILPNYGG